MNGINKEINYLSGYKTYLIAFVTTVYGIFWHHTSVSTLAPYLLSGLGLAALRAAVAKIEAVVAAIEAKLPTSIANEVKPIVANVENDLNKVL